MRRSFFAKINQNKHIHRKPPLYRVKKKVWRSTEKAEYKIDYPRQGGAGEGKMGWPPDK